MLRFDSGSLVPSATLYLPLLRGQPARKPCIASLHLSFLIFKIRMISVPPGSLRRILGALERASDDAWHMLSPQ